MFPHGLLVTSHVANLCADVLQLKMSQGGSQAGRASALAVRTSHSHCRQPHSFAPVCQVDIIFVLLMMKSENSWEALPQGSKLCDLSAQGNKASEAFSNFYCKSLDRT